MTVRDVDERTVLSALELAARAPSVHNSQPWQWVLGDSSIHLYADVTRWLPATDADGRDIMVSCGAALHHLRVALAAAGVAANVRRLPNRHETDHLAAVEVSASDAADADIGLASAILQRRTDRRLFDDWEVPVSLISELTDRAADQGVVLRAITDAAPRAALHDAIRNADRFHEGILGYQGETAAWSGRHTFVDGVPHANRLRDAATTGAGTARRFSAGALEQSSGQPDGALLVVLGTASDDPLSQLRAGEALSSVLLRATKFGLASCVLSQPVEVASTRLHIRDRVLYGSMCPQVVLRLGWASTGPPLPPTPRRPLEDQISTARCSEGIRRHSS